MITQRPSMSSLTSSSVRRAELVATTPQCGSGAPPTNKDTAMTNIAFAGAGYAHAIIGGDADVGTTFLDPLIFEQRVVHQIIGPAIADRVDQDPSARILCTLPQQRANDLRIARDRMLRAGIGNLRWALTRRVRGDKAAETRRLAKLTMQVIKGTWLAVGLPGAEDDLDLWTEVYQTVAGDGRKVSGIEVRRKVIYTVEPKHVRPDIKVARMDAD